MLSESAELPQFLQGECPAGCWRLPVPLWSRMATLAHAHPPPRLSLLPYSTSRKQSVWPDSLAHLLFLLEDRGEAGGAP